MINNFHDLIRENNTAFYTFDISRLKERIRFLQSFLPKNTALCYAVKANPFVIREVSNNFDKLEVCSPGEAAICNSLNIPTDKMVISGVYKTPEYIEKFFSDSEFHGIFTVESLTQYKLLCDLSRKYRKKTNFIVRLTNDSQFGMNATDIEDIIQTLEKHPNMHCIGIQFFSGTQKTSIKKLKREVAQLDQFLIHLKETYRYSVEFLEYGPGFPVSYFDMEDFDEESFLREFRCMLNEMTYKTQIILELGRSIVASCGNYYTHIVDIKNNNGQNYLLIDGGMHHIVYYGQMMAAKHPKLTVPGKHAVIADKLWTVCGSLCSMHDIIVKQIALPDVKIGDVICFENTGAYCMTEGMSLFLSRDIPPVYLILENNEIICVREIFETAQLNTPKYERTTWKD